MEREVTARSTIQWQPAYPLQPRPILMWTLGNALQLAARIGCCERCGRFFLRAKRQHQRFCTRTCSIAFHNERRQRDGYFKKRRRLREEGLGDAVPLRRARGGAVGSRPRS